jgi:H+/Cl- antiporter ClcA
MSRFVKNPFFRAFLGGAIVLVLTILVDSYDYNGAGMDVITNAISGDAKPEAFILKILFTAITLAAGFRGGEIVPVFFVGSTFGCVIAPILGVDPGFGAASGMSSLFCSVTKSPIASIFLAVEIFGAKYIIFFALVCGITYVMSGYNGLYKTFKPTE